MSPIGDNCSPRFGLWCRFLHNIPNLLLIAFSYVIIAHTAFGDQPLAVNEHLSSSSSVGKFSTVSAEKNFLKVRHKWRSRLDAFLQRTSNGGLTSEDYFEAFDIADKLVLDLSGVVEDAKSTFLAANFLQTALTELAPYLSKHTSNYIYWLTDLATYFVHSNRRQEAESYLMFCEQLIAEMESDHSYSLSEAQNQLSITMAQTYYYRALSTYYAHFLLFEEALDAQQKCFKASVELLELPSFTPNARLNNLVECANSWVQVAGACMTVMQIEDALNKSHGSKDKFSKFLDSGKLFEPYLSKSSDVLCLLVRIYAFSEKFSDARRVLDTVEKDNGVNPLSLFDAKVALSIYEGTFRGESLNDLDDFFNYARRKGSALSLMSVGDFDLLDTYALLLLQSDQREKAVEVLSFTAQAKALFRKSLLQYKEGDSLLKSLVALNELSLIVDVLDDHTVAHTMLNAKNAVFRAAIGGFPSEIKLVDIQNAIAESMLYFNYLHYEDWKSGAEMILCLRVSKHGWSLSRFQADDSFLNAIRKISNAVRSAHDVGTLDVNGLLSALKLSSLTLFPSDSLMLNGQRVGSVIIDPSGVLSDVPWWVLPDSNSIPLFVQSDLSLAYSPARLTPRVEPLQLRKAIILADPEAGSDFELPGARTEANRLFAKFSQKNFSVSKYLANDASPQRLSQETDILHIACHAEEVQSEKRLYASPVLRLSCETTNSISKISPLYIAANKSNRDLVSLAACFSGTGEEWRGEGKFVFEGRFGLVRAFLISGARCVISSLWQVGDSDSPLFFDKFYDYLDDQPPVTAFNNTLRSIWEEQNQSGLALFVCRFGGFVIAK